MLNRLSFVSMLRFAFHTTIAATKSIGKLENHGFDDCGKYKKTTIVFS